MTIMLLVQILAIAMIVPYSVAVDNGSLQKTFEDPNNSGSTVSFLVSVFAITIVMLIIAKLKLGWLVKLIIHAVIFLNLLVMSSTLLNVYFPNVAYVDAFCTIVSLSLAVLLYVYPEWYIIDIVGIGLSASFGYLMGGFMSVQVAILLLLIFSIYDLIAVFGSKHMVALANMALDLKLPLLFVIPPSLNYSYVKQKMDLGSHTGVQLIGFGDAVFPAILIVAVKVAGGSLAMVYGVAAGTLIGCVVLEYVLLNFNKPLPALPFLCPCAIVGYEFMRILFG